MERDLVVLIHGLNRTSLSMLPLAYLLRQRGFDTLRWGYASRRRSIVAHARELDRELTPLLRERAGRVHFVTHSLGGIIVRAYLREVTLDNLGRVVMLAPPNSGSEVADVLQRFGLARLAAGIPGEELGTADDSVPNQLADVAFELGVIAGDREINPLFSRWIGAPNDGKVAVARTQVRGMRDFVVVPHGHTMLPMTRAAGEKTVAFLESGRFR